MYIIVVAAWVDLPMQSCALAQASPAPWDGVSSRGLPAHLPWAQGPHAHSCQINSSSTSYSHCEVHTAIQFAEE